MKHIKLFENYSTKKVLILHGLGGGPTPEKAEVLKKRGYEVIFPLIDYVVEYEKDKMKSKFNELLELDVDLILGQSLGGYTGFLLGNMLNVDTILINPAIDRSRTKLEIKEFDIDYDFSNNNLEIYFGKLDTLVPMNFAIDYLEKNNIQYDKNIVDDMEHRSSAEKIDEILDISKFIK